VNLDETETTAQTKPNNVVAERGKKQVAANNSSKLGVLSALVICISAGGNFIPPFIIVSRRKGKQKWHMVRQ